MKKKERKYILITNFRLSEGGRESESERVDEDNLTFDSFDICFALPNPYTAGQDIIKFFSLSFPSVHFLLSNILEHVSKGKLQAVRFLSVGW